MFKSTVKTKYTQIHFSEEFYEGTASHWLSVDLAWTDRSDAMAKTFAVLMDDRLQAETRVAISEAVENPTRDIRLEDGSLIVTLKSESKHLAAPIIGLVQKLEAEFDASVERGKK